LSTLKNTNTREYLLIRFAIPKKYLSINEDGMRKIIIKYLSINGGILTLRKADK
jgi:hypothetical protein